MVISELRNCNNCHIFKPIAEFYKNTKYRFDYKCKDCRKELRSQWYYEKKASNPGHFLAGFEKRKAKYAENKRAVFELLGDKCIFCADSHVPALTIDHPNKDGAESRRNGERTERLCEAIVRNPSLKSKYRLLCMKCNWLRRYESDEEIIARYGEKIPQT